jgi:hypothetical protein
MQIFKGFDELRADDGTEIGASDRIEITQNRIDTFAECDRSSD